MVRNFKEWFAAAKTTAGGLAGVILQDEMALAEKSAEEVYTELAARLLVMSEAANAAMDAPQPAGLIEGQAQRQARYAGKGGYLGQALNTAMAYALSCSEVNASMGRICAAPTAGASGVLPAVLLTVRNQNGASEQELLDALLVASGVGGIIMQNATVAGSEGGCQAECGAAAAMAAAAAVVLAGGSPAQAGQAVSIALMNCMGLVCDPVAGLVQLPCSYRNASQTVNALLSADLALAGQDAVIPPDDAVEAMYRVGRQLPPELRETAMGGIAATPTGRTIRKQMQRQQALPLEEGGL